MENEIRKKALGYLARREHSHYELERKLKNRFNLAEIRSVLKDLAQENCQSDARFTESYIRSRSESGYGPLRIAVELKQRGVQEETIEKFLVTDADFWEGILRKLYQKKIKLSSIKNDTDKARIYRFLLQRGFEPHMIKKCCI